MTQIDKETTTEFGSGYLNMELLRFSTAGSVDDGKSTLIGRLLYDSKSIFEDQLEAIKEASKRSGTEGVNLALLTDGLRAEREQGITIDVAYRYFATPKRKFIIADTPGHIQYTRNMVTGASTADLAIILIDARLGILEQTIRHSYIASLLQIPNVVVCINKMDLVDFSEEVYNNILEGYKKITNAVTLRNVRFVPISARDGDNVVDRSVNTPWYTGQTLLDILETTPITHKINSEAARLPVQYVIRPYQDQFHDYRGYGGRLAGGTFSVGDPVVVLPSGIKSTIKTINDFDKELETAFAPQSVSIQLGSQVDVSRGDMIVKDDNHLPQVGQNIALMVCWLNEKPLQLNSRYIIRHATAETKGSVKEINFKVNLSSIENNYADKTIHANDIAMITIRTAKPLVFDPYSQNRITGSLVFIDESTFETVGAGMIVDDLENATDGRFI
jgi:sulfate adenylyltransferase subunit 1